MLSCSIWISAPSFWMGGGLENRCVGRVYGADGNKVLNKFYLCTVHFKIYVVHPPTNALFINLVISFKLH